MALTPTLPAQYGKATDMISGTLTELNLPTTYLHMATALGSRKLAGDLLMELISSGGSTVGATAPSPATAFWIDTSNTPSVLNFWDSSLATPAYVPVGSGSGSGGTPEVRNGGTIPLVGEEDLWIDGGVLKVRQTDDSFVAPVSSGSGIHTGATAPTGTESIWIDTSVSPAVIRRDTSAAGDWSQTEELGGGACCPTVVGHAPAVIADFPNGVGQHVVDSAGVETTLLTINGIPQVATVNDAGAIEVPGDPNVAPTDITGGLTAWDRIIDTVGNTTYVYNGLVFHPIPGASGMGSDEIQIGGTQPVAGSGIKIWITSDGTPYYDPNGDGDFTDKEPLYDADALASGVVTPGINIEDAYATPFEDVTISNEQGAQHLPDDIIRQVITWDGDDGKTPDEDTGSFDQVVLYGLTQGSATGGTITVDVNGITVTLNVADLPATGDTSPFTVTLPSSITVVNGAPVTITINKQDQAGGDIQIPVMDYEPLYGDVEYSSNGTTWTAWNSGNLSMAVEFADTTTVIGTTQVSPTTSTSGILGQLISVNGQCFLLTAIDETDPLNVIYTWTAITCPPTTVWVLSNGDFTLSGQDPNVPAENGDVVGRTAIDDTDPNNILIYRWTGTQWVSTVLPASGIVTPTTVATAPTTSTVGVEGELVNDGTNCYLLSNVQAGNTYYQSYGSISGTVGGSNVGGNSAKFTKSLSPSLTGGVSCTYTITLTGFKPGESYANCHVGFGGNVSGQISDSGTLAFNNIGDSHTITASGSVSSETGLFLYVLNAGLSVNGFFSISGSLTGTTPITNPSVYTWDQVICNNDAFILSNGDFTIDGSGNPVETSFPANTTVINDTDPLNPVFWRWDGADWSNVTPLADTSYVPEIVIADTSYATGQPTGGFTGTFTSQEGFTVTVQNGIIISVV